MTGLEIFKKYGLQMFGAAALLIGAALLVHGGFWVRDVLAERDMARAAATVASRAVAALEAEARAGRAALADREARIMRLSEEKHTLITKLKEVYENDPNARAWADCPVPDSVLCLLQ